MSDTATLTRCPGDSRIAASTFLTVMACGMEPPGCRHPVVPGDEARFYRGHARAAHDAPRTARRGTQNAATMTHEARTMKRDTPAQGADGVPSHGVALASLHA